MTKLVEFLFGVRKHGEPVKIVSSVKVREVKFKDFENWCREYNVSCRSKRDEYSFIN